MNINQKNDIVKNGFTSDYTKLAYGKTEVQKVKKKFFCFIIVSLILSLFVIPKVTSAKETETFSTDSYTLKDAQNEVIKYLKDNKKNYKIGSEQFVNFLESATKLDFKKYNKDLIQTYSSIYLAENEEYQFEQATKENKDKEEKPFVLSNSLLNKKIKEIRVKNEDENTEVDNEVKDLQSQPSLEFNALSSYNRTNAKKYMTNNWKNTSSSLYGYLGGSGGDCTNYASQVVHAGGMPTSLKGYYGSHYTQTTTGWFSVKEYRVQGTYKINYSTSWVRVKDFYGYWAGTKKHKVYSNLTASQVSKKVSTGDVVQVYNRNSGNWFHTVVVYDVKKGETRFSAHSGEHLYAHLPFEFKGSKYRFRVIKF